MQQYPPMNGQPVPAQDYSQSMPQGYPPQGWQQSVPQQPVPPVYSQQQPVVQPMQQGYTQSTGYQPMPNGYSQSMPQQPMPDPYAQSIPQQPVQSDYSQSMPYQPVQDAYSQSMPQQPAQPDPYTGSQPVQPEAPAPAEPKQTKRRPRMPYKRLNKVQIGVIIASVLVVVIFIFASFFRPTSNASNKVQRGTISARYSGTCLIVRDETPYEAESVTSIEYVAAEGSQVGRGATICNVFSTGYSASALVTLQNYRDQIRDYQLSLLKEEKAYDSQMERYSSDVLLRAAEVRAIISGQRGNLITEEQLLREAITTRQSYILTKYSTDQRLSRFLDDEQAQQQRIDSWTKQFKATAASLVSFYTDGYEYTVNTSTATTFTPSEVRAMINGKRPEGNTSKTRTTIYRTIEDGHWMVLMLMDDTGWNPTVDGIYELQLERYENTVASARVVSFTRSGGELLVCLEIEGSVEPVLYMRTASATLGDRVQTFKVSTEAIHKQDEMDGVVAVINGTGYFVPVHIVYSSGAYAYVTPVTAGFLEEGMTLVLNK